METIINRGYKFKIVPTKEQKEFFLQSFGCARKIYNMYVDELYRKLEESGYQNGKIKKSELHLSKYTDFSRQFDYWKKKIFWSDGYFACSIGEVSSSTIQKYIESQG